MTTEEIITRIEERLSKPGAWIKTYSARNAYGVPVDAMNEAAVSWCLLGAIRAETDNVGAYTAVALRIRDVLNRHEAYDSSRLYQSISGFNDNPKTTLEDIQRVLSEAKGGQ